MDCFVLNESIKTPTRCPKKTPLKDKCDYLAKKRFLGHTVDNSGKVRVNKTPPRAYVVVP